MWWALFAAFAVAAVWLHSWRIALLGLLTWCLYEFVLVPTLCRVLKQQGHPCTERVRGRLFACAPDHQHLKTEALLRLIALRPKATEVHGRLTSVDRAIIALAGVGTIATVVGMVYGFR